MKVVLKQSDAQEPYSFAFINAAGKTSVRSENYKAKKSAENGIESVRKNSQEAGRYECKIAKNGKHFFNLKASNGQVIATSGMLASEADRDAAISELTAGAADAPLES